MATKIEPCPFCGGQRLHIHQQLLSYSVACESCKARGSHHRDVETALCEWNRTSKHVRWAVAANDPLSGIRFDNIEHAVEKLNSVLLSYKTEVIKKFESNEELEH